MKGITYKHMSIPTEWYKTFYQVAKAGSISRAAQQLFITQPAVSRSIQQLEAGLGCPLFFRTAKGVALTREGDQLFKYVEQAFALLRLGEKKLAQLQDLEIGELSIGVGDTICSHYLVPHLHVFHDRYPGIRIHITNQKTWEIIAMLKRGEIDIGIGNLPVDDEHLRITPVMAIHDVFVTGVKYRHLAENTLPLANLANYPTLLVERGSLSRALVDRFFQEQGLTLSPDFELGNFELLAQFARADFGLACIIREFFSQEIAEGKLFEIPVDPPLPERHIGVFGLKSVPLSAAAAALIYILMAESWPQN